MLRVMLVTLLAPAGAYLVGSAPHVGRAEGRQLRGPQMVAQATLDKKQEKIDAVKDVLGDTALLFCARSEGVPVNTLNELRQKLPEGVTMRCVKNTLMKRATEGTQFEIDDALLFQSNFWFFVPEADMKATVNLWDDMVKNNKFEEVNEIKGGVFDGEKLDAKGIAKVKNLPTKQELMQQTATLINTIPTNLASLIKEAQGQKLARAVDAMKEKLE
mmetsp:Transcript_3089/g.5111  ORF Transcript_3089/g.5111 Transcript_3089/m.5111 type:complete len:216 (+) Transcript_3089:50-697(+)